MRLLSMLLTLALISGCDDNGDDGAGGAQGMGGEAGGAPGMGGEAGGAPGMGGEAGGAPGTGGEAGGAPGMGGEAGGAMADECELLTDDDGNQVTCGMGDPPCPEDYQCSGIPADVCYRGPCDLPRCLSADARIATPAGEIKVATLRVGDEVWTQARDGQRVAAPLIQVGSVPAPADHQMIRVRLSDGRSVRASPDHPDASGRPLIALSDGAVYDGARVLEVGLELYGQPRTYDILPAGSTGLYWVDGVLMGSTLRPPRGILSTDSWAPEATEKTASLMRQRGK